MCKRVHGMKEPTYNREGTLFRIFTLFDGDVISAKGPGEAGFQGSYIMRNLGRTYNLFAELCSSTLAITRVEVLNL